MESNSSGGSDRRSLLAGRHRRGALVMKAELKFWLALLWVLTHWAEAGRDV